MPHSMQIFFFFLICALTTSYALLENNQLSLLKKTYQQCENKTEVFKCLKIKALKLMENLTKSKKLSLFGVVELNQEKPAIESNRTGRLLSFGLNEDALNNIRDEKISDLFYQAAENFLETRSININMPKLVEEARRRRRKGQKYMGPFLAAMAIKGAMLAMAYKGITAMAGAALLIGKIALTLAAILGLKKLVSTDKEKTTLEIIKHPSYSNHHSYSNSYEDEGHSGHYGRSLNLAADMAFLDKIRSQRF